MASQDDILTIPEVASLLKVGGQWRFRRTAIDTWIEVKTHAAGVRPENDGAKVKSGD